MQRRRSDDISAVFLAHEDLLRISRTQLDERIAALKQLRPLSRGEMEVVARQRRLVINRESARRTRIRQKSYVDALEAENAALRDRLAQLEEQYAPRPQPQPIHPLLAGVGTHGAMDVVDVYDVVDALFSDSETLSF
jgi:hypothetical protein